MSFSESRERITLTITLTDFGLNNEAFPKTYAFMVVKYQADRTLINHVPFAGDSRERYKMRRPEDVLSLSFNLNSTSIQ